MTTIPLARYRFDCVVTQDIALPDYSGSVLRGVFGAALRQLACVTKQKTCVDCPLRAGCPYTRIFDDKTERGAQAAANITVPNPYVIEPPNWGEKRFRSGERFAFHLVLVGQALTDLALIVLAFQRALQRGIGRAGAGKAQLEQIVHCQADGSEQVVLEVARGELQVHQNTISVPQSAGASERVTLRLLTPTRLQRDGHVLTPRAITARDFLVTLMRRVSSVLSAHTDTAMNFDAPRLARLADTINAEGKLEFRDWTRYSARQQREMQLGGLMGRWTLQGELAPFMPFLKMGQWLHVGKNTTFGLGHYVIEGSTTA